MLAGNARGGGVAREKHVEIKGVIQIVVAPLRRNVLIAHFADRTFFNLEADIWRSHYRVDRPDVGLAGRDRQIRFAGARTQQQSASQRQQ